MAEIIQCPSCLRWLNLETHDAQIVGEIWEGVLVYGCERCGATFTELGDVVELGRPNSG